MFITPKDIEDVTGLTEGNIFQGELSLEQLFFNRPVPGWARYRTPVKDLWMCGSATHPGGGIMGAPGRIAALELLKAEEARREAGGADGEAIRRRRDRRRPQRPGRRRVPGEGRQGRLVLERRERVGGILDTQIAPTGSPRRASCTPSAGSGSR